ncbi:hypothetical protein EYF80_027212 [Liparis tanakae]|uniref:Uncharacterized protein n=1 Tax=Liparis tanakae TaxID=230148 RepID=A0A4Z2HC72_9TELE|nr:hypothetical protein EYF80_027212 [Liparis tanakae]
MLRRLSQPPPGSTSSAVMERLEEARHCLSQLVGRLMGTEEQTWRRERARRGKLQDKRRSASTHSLRVCNRKKSTWALTESEVISFETKRKVIQCSRFKDNIGIKGH